ncbi:hypothetical protein [Chachezhania sediminis]|uniref:hypothetical protein n=1 Tax=Chachezhania sediminis TaxID=2599291 RepID=UPI00131BDEB7|nr:hypothetical protein [Chachezhania sediminis]
MTERKRAIMAARHLPQYLQDVAFSKFSAKAERKRKVQGTFGAAGPARRIDPQTGEVIEVIAARPERTSRAASRQARRQIDE